MIIIGKYGNVIKLNNIRFKRKGKYLNTTSLIRLPDRYKKDKFTYLFKVSNRKKAKLNRISANNLHDFKTKLNQKQFKVKK